MERDSAYPATVWRWVMSAHDLPIFFSSLGSIDGPTPLDAKPNSAAQLGSGSSPPQPPNYPTAAGSVREKERVGFLGRWDDSEDSIQ